MAMLNNQRVKYSKRFRKKMWAIGIHSNLPGPCSACRAQVAWCYELDVFDQQVSLLGGIKKRNWYKVVPQFVS